MKILFYNHTGQVSGAERVLLMTLAALDSSIESVVLCPVDGQLIQLIDELGIRTAGLNPLAARFTWRPDRLIRYFASFARVIRMARVEVVRETPDLIHANSIRAGLVMSAATAGLGIPIVWHAHDLLPRHPLSTAIRLFALASRRNRIIAVSQAVSDCFRGVLLRWFPRRVPVTKIHNAVDPERFQPDLENRQELRRALGIKESQLLVGTVGQLTPRKGQLEVIEAFTEVAREIPDAVLL
ncbi:MAG TPA: glycosyltransferase family 4 protein, partial [Pyrinomonadaceae bacterium]|nr:glycosyltransferase family 4 protein [Pyrinomonadaceae bacterium]